MPKHLPERLLEARNAEQRSWAAGMTLAEGAGAPNVLVDARYRAIESVIPSVIPVPVRSTLSCTGGQSTARHEV